MRQDPSCKVSEQSKQKNPCLSQLRIIPETILLKVETRIVPKPHSTIIPYLKTHIAHKSLPPFGNTSPETTSMIRVYLLQPLLTNDPNHAP
jgi:hypothetical protein